MQGGTPKAERGVLEVRRSEWRGGPTPQMGVFQQPVTGADYTQRAQACQGESRLCGRSVRL